MGFLATLGMTVGRDGIRPLLVPLLFGAVRAVSMDSGEGRNDESELLPIFMRDEQQLSG